MKITIRNANADDSEPLNELVSQLGYLSDLEKINHIWTESLSLYE